MLDAKRGLCYNSLKICLGYYYKIEDDGKEVFMQKHINKILIFIVNVLLMVIAVLVIKMQDQKNLAIKIITDSTLEPLDSKILNTQNAISTDRENKLRELNSTPQALQTKQITTTTNTAVTKPNASTSSSRTTRKS